MEKGLTATLVRINSGHFLGLHPLLVKYVCTQYIWIHIPTETSATCIANHDFFSGSLFSPLNVVGMLHETSCTCSRVQIAVFVLYLWTISQCIEASGQVSWQEKDNKLGSGRYSQRFDFCGTKRM